MSQNLFEAIRQNKIKKVNQILKKNPDVNMKDTEDDGDTPLIVSAEDGLKNITELFIQRGAEIDKTNNFGETPLMKAAYKGKKDIVDLLIKNGANVNIKDDEGNTPLIWAVTHPRPTESNTDVVKLLLNSGAVINETNTNGETALTIAKKKGFPEDKKDIIDIIEKELNLKRAMPISMLSEGIDNTNRIPSHIERYALNPDLYREFVSFMPPAWANERSENVSTGGKRKNKKTRNLKTRNLKKRNLKTRMRYLSKKNKK
jgi:ankyrin repeat protein